MSKFRFVSTIFLASLLFAQTACDGVKVEAPSARVEWFIGVDITSSVKAEEFNAYPSIALESVLSRLRAGDRVHVLLINSDPQQGVKTFRLDDGKAGVAGKAAEIYEHFKSLKRPAGYRGTTNIGGFFSYVKEVVNRARQEEASLKGKGKTTPRASQYVALVLSDGKPEGKQMSLEGEWPPDTQVWALGVDQKYNAAFRSLCEKQMKIPEASVRVVSFATWESGIQTFGLDINRPQNRALRDELETGVRQTAGV